MNKFQNHQNLKFNVIIKYDGNKVISYRYLDLKVQSFLPTCLANMPCRCKARAWSLVLGYPTSIQPWRARVIVINNSRFCSCHLWVGISNVQFLIQFSLTYFCSVKFFLNSRWQNEWRAIQSFAHCDNIPCKFYFPLIFTISQVWLVKSTHTVLWWIRCVL